MIKMKFVSQIVFLFALAFIADGCKKDGFPVPPASTVPLFSYTIDNDGFAPATVTFINESIVPEESGLPTYSWKFGDGSTSTEENPTHPYTASGVFDVKLTIKTSISGEIVELTKSVLLQNANASGVPVYFTDGTNVYLGLLNSDKPLFSALPIGPFKDSYGLALDTINSKLYISDFDSKKIFQCDPDGKNFKEFRTGLPGPDGLAIDYEGNRLFWDTDNGVQYADLSASDLNQKVDFATGQAGDPEGVSVDPANKKLYWNTYNDAGVWVKNLDGTGEAVLIPGVGGGSTLVVNNKLFYDHFIATLDIHLKFSNLDGTGIGTVSTAISRLVFGIAYEPESQQIYWGDRTPGKIMRSNLDGSGVETWYTSAGSSPRGIVFGKKK